MALTCHATRIDLQYTSAPRLPTAYDPDPKTPNASEFETRIEGHGDMETPIVARSLEIKPKRAKSDWLSLLSLQIDAEEIRGTVLTLGKEEQRGVSQPIDDGSPAEVVTALLALTESALGAALAELDLKFDM